MPQATTFETRSVYMERFLKILVLIGSFFVGYIQAAVDETVWIDLHNHYQNQEWVQKPSMFAETIVKFFPKTGTVLELGAGIGQDSIYFASLGYQVVSSDIEIGSLSSHVSHQDEGIRNRITIKKIDLNNRLPFEADSIDIVYAHLSLHYFDASTTKQIFDEIRRILRCGGILAFLSNSTKDPEYQTGIFLEDDFFLIGKAKKRYMTPDSACELAKDFQPLLLDELGETYKDQAKGVKFLIRYVGQK